MECASQEQSGACKFISNAQPDTQGVDDILYKILRISNGTDLEPCKSLLGTLDDEEVQDTVQAQDKSQQEIATARARDAASLCSLESGVLYLDGRMMEAG